MELMGRYAAANHELIHAYMARALGVEVLLDIENHHNFAWRERHRLPDGSEAEVIVHRRGPRHRAGVLGSSRLDGPRLHRPRQGRGRSLNSARTARVSDDRPKAKRFSHGTRTAVPALSSVTLCRRLARCRWLTDSMR